MVSFIITDQGDREITRLSAPNADKALEQASNLLHMPEEDLQVWTPREYQNTVLNKPWWVLSAEGIWP